MDIWVNFYEPFFNTRAESVAFVHALETLDSDSPRHQAKILMHQTQRLISLADDIENIRKGKEALQVLFLMICAENVSKLFHKFCGEGRSRAHVRRFFSEFINANDRRRLETSFTTHDLLPLNLRAIADCLYSIRCDVVHQGHYWSFHLRNEDTPMINIEPDVIVHISFKDLRAIVVRAALHAIRRYEA